MAQTGRNMTSNAYGYQVKAKPLSLSYGTVRRLAGVPNNNERPWVSWYLSDYAAPASLTSSASGNLSSGGNTILPGNSTYSS